MNKILLLFLPIFILAVSCSDNRDIAGPYAQADFDERYANGIPPSLDSIFTQTNITKEEKDALTFLYAYMPLADVLNYGAAFHLDNVRAAFKTAEEMPWGDKIPDREFRHFVLPVRVNNEDLDMARPIFYEELKDRVKGLSMTDAILEVNHWCHEKVTFRPSDSRTNSPLATMSAALGRGGEESIFLVAALRSIGIPARLIYTPRWAHTDDSHSWVEAWSDGRWRFLGACEPEAVLDLGWFNDAASRGMIISTRVFGRYDGHEEVIGETPMSTTINVTSNYAATSPVRVLVTDANDNPIEGADVTYSIYNFAEFFPALTLQTDENGMVEIHTGLGDLIVWVNKDDKFQVKLANATKTCHVKLDLDSNFTGSRNFDIIPPVSYNLSPKVDPKAADENNRRKAEEDSLRLAYVSSFFTPEKARELATKINANPSKIIPIMTSSRGNWATIEDFLLSNPDKADKAVALLSVINPKDLNDVTTEALSDHLSTIDVNSDLYVNYILNPTVSKERITPYKEYLSSQLKDQCATPEDLINWVRANITVDTIWNNPQLPISPIGVWKAKKSGKLSRDIFFVAAARSLGIASRIDPVTGHVQYHNGERWNNVNFTDHVHKSTPYGKVKLVCPADASQPQAKYYTQFTISKIENGRPHLLEYPDSCDDKYFAEPRDLSAGQYMLITGERLTNGGVMARAVFFNITEGNVTEVPLTIRHDSEHISVAGSFDSNNSVIPLDYSGRVTILSETGRGNYILGMIDPRKASSRQLLNDICDAAPQLEALGRRIILLMPPEPANIFDPAAYPEFPNNVLLASDPDNYIYHTEFLQNLTPGSHTMPKFIIADTFNRALWVKEGYSPELIKEIIDALAAIEGN